MGSRVNILIVEDDPDLSVALEEALSEGGQTVMAAPSVAAAVQELGRRDFDVIVLDMNLPDGSGEQVLQRVTELELLSEVIVLTGSPDPAAAVRMIKQGAYDYLLKPIQTEELQAQVEQAAQKARLRRENISLRVRLERHEAIPGVVTIDPEMKRAIDALDRVATSELPVLILGESGTGKELFARAVHRRSPRASGPFVALNCAALQDNLLESELFGYEKGAFTGAQNRKPGLMEVADRGVLFLDEVGDLSPAVQVKLLRAIETKEFMHLGGTRPLRTDIRIVSATNKDLEALADEGTFRRDLFYRLNGVSLSLPPLRERPGDIQPLADHFLSTARQKKTLSPKAFDLLSAYSWPGNVRELQMVVLGAAVMAKGDTIEPQDLPVAVQGRRRPTSAPREGLTLAEVEREHIKMVLGRTGGHRGRAARILGIDVRTLYNKLGSSRPSRKGGDEPENNGT
jgi:DNA-binding NtrC family response regulator